MTDLLDLARDRAASFLKELPDRHVGPPDAREALLAATEDGFAVFHPETGALELRVEGGDPPRLGGALGRPRGARLRVATARAGRE